jgi:O-antigen ligase
MNKNIFKWIVMGGLFIVPFIPFFVSSSFFFPYITSKAFAWRILIEIVFGAWIILAALVPEYRPKKSLILYSLLAFLVVIGIADIFGEAPIKSFWSNFERMEGFISLLHLGAFFVVIGSVFDESSWRKWWNTNLIASLIMIIYCLFQIGGAIEIHQGGVRVDGTFGNAAYLAIYMLINIFISILLYIKSRGSNMKWAYILLLIGQTSILYYTATRGAILGLLGGLLLVALLNIRNREEVRVRKLSIGFLAALVVLIGGFFALKNTSFVKNSPVLGRFASISLSEIKTEGRSFVWPIALEGIKERPIFGWGQENFNYVFNQHYKPQMYRIEPWFDRAHNIFLDWAIAGGILGIIAYLALYGILIYSIWKKDQSLTYGEKTLFIGLLAAYFFHNIFVFDHLLSYILFIAILAYIHSQTTSAPIFNKEISKSKINNVLVPVTAVLLVLSLYFVNIKPMRTNLNLIDALQIVQGSGDKTQALPAFQKAYGMSSLGRPEVTEWIGTSVSNILNSNISEVEKQKFSDFAKYAVGKQADDYSTDARYQLLAGDLFTQLGDVPNAAKYLERAEKLIPGKQQVYYEQGSLLINVGNFKGALEIFKKAYDLAPQNTEAGVMYLIGAIYAKDEALMKELIAKLPPESILQNDSVIKALYTTERFSDLAVLLEARLTQNPNDPQNYINLSIAYIRIGKKKEAIDLLNKLKELDPSYSKDVDSYIKAINEGKI